MAYDRAEHVAGVRERQQSQMREVMPLVRLVAGAAPVMHGLTQDEHWNRYLSFLQGMLERFVKSRDAAKEKLASPAVWSHEDLLKLKCDVLVASATIEAFTFAMELPKAIIGGQDEAQRIIKEFEAKSESAGKTES